MPNRPLKAVIEHLHAANERDGGGRTDGELLAHFLSQKDEDALAALVHRHASMVWGVCCRILRETHDAEDAFQATFLVLVRKAVSVPRHAVANWLYGVARQTSVRVRSTAVKRGRRENQVMNMPEQAMPDIPDADVHHVLDEELSRLPGHYRGVVVLCDLEELTRKEAARQLGIPEGSVASRLARARALLTKRLQRRGIAFTGSLAAALTSSSASSAPPALIASTIKVASLLAAGQAAGVISANVAALIEGMEKAMVLSKLKSAVSVVMILGVMAVGPSYLAYRAAAAGLVNSKSNQEKEREPQGKQESQVYAPIPKQEKKPLTAWGEEIGGLQAGLGFLSAEKRDFHPGDTFALVVRVRNVGQKEVSFQFLKQFFMENPPTFTDKKGNVVEMKFHIPKEIYKPEDVTLASEKEFELFRFDIALGNQANALGTFQIQYERVLGNTSLSSVPIKTDPALFQLATGKLDLVVVKEKDVTVGEREKQASENAADLLQGEWAVAAWQEEGENANANELKTKKVVIKGNAIYGVEPGVNGGMSFQLNPGKNPNEIDLTVLDGKRKGITEPGIYKIEGDQLHLCFGGKQRPKEFATTKGSGHTLLVLRKELIQKIEEPVANRLSAVNAPIPKNDNTASKLALNEAVELLKAIKPNSRDALERCRLWASIAQLSMKLGDRDGAKHAVVSANEAANELDDNVVSARGELLRDVAKEWGRLGEVGKVLEITSSLPKADHPHDTILRESAEAAAESGHYEAGLQIAKELPKEEKNEWVNKELKRLDIIYRAKQGVTAALIQEVEQLPDGIEKVAIYVGRAVLNRNYAILELTNDSLFDKELLAGNRKQAIAMVHNAEAALKKLNQENHQRFSMFMISRAYALLKDPRSIRKNLQQYPPALPKSDPNYGVYESSNIQTKAMLAAAEAASGNIDAANDVVKEFTETDDQVYVLMYIGLALHKEGKTDHVKATFGKAHERLDRLGKNTLAIHNLASAEAICGDFNAAIATASSYRTEGIAFSNVSYYMMKAGQFNEARKLTLKQVESMFWQGTVLNAIAEAQTKAGQLKEVKEWIAEEDNPVRKAYATVGMANGLYSEKSPTK